MDMKRRRWAGKTINVSGIDYTVKYVKHIQSGRIGKSEPAARIDFDKRVIQLLDSLSPTEEIVYMIHELCHATLEVIIPTKLLDKNAELEELVVGPFARILAGALQSASLLRKE